MIYILIYMAIGFVCGAAAYGISLAWSRDITDIYLLLTATANTKDAYREDRKWAIGVGVMVFVFPFMLIAVLIKTNFAESGFTLW